MICMCTRWVVMMCSDVMCSDGDDMCRGYGVLGMWW